MDYGDSGLISTLEACKCNGIDYVGAGENIFIARQFYTTKVRGHTVAILNFAENEFSTTHDNNHGANPLDLVVNYRDIIAAKAIADFVIVIVHGGNEMYDLPSPGIKKVLHFFADAGANVIIGHHAHCYSGYEEYQGVPIFYGLGNFLFDIPNMSDSIWNFGYAVELLLDHELTFNIIPYQQCGQKAGIRLLDSGEQDQFYANLSRLNTIIADDKLLVTEFQKFCLRVSSRYTSFLEPYSSSFLHYLRNRNLIPSLISKRKKRLYLNLMRCESHREIVINLLKAENDQ